MENNRIENESLKHLDETEGKSADSDNSFLEKLITGWNVLLANKRYSGIIRNLSYTVAAFIFVIFILVFLSYIIPVLQEIPGAEKNDLINSTELMKDPAYKRQISQLSRDVQRLSRRYNNYASGQSYLVVNTTDNLFYLYRNKKLIREGFCSSGSYTMLQTEEGKSWTFKTPKGKFWIQGKTTNPTWRKPDWAFVEEGLPVPPPEDPSRYEYGVLGEYALALGDGYLIHGTLYKRFLGMPVTHGCVRLNDEDLEAIFNSLSIGSKVFIF